MSFKAGQYADAVKHYTEAVKRLPSDPKALNNRAAAYTKLLAMPEALRDAEAAIKIDPTFIKAYIRKALTQQAMKELTSAIETLQKATDMDKEKKVRRHPYWPLTTAHARARVESPEHHDGAAAATLGGDRRADLQPRHA